MIKNIINHKKLHSNKPDHPSYEVKASHQTFGHVGSVRQHYKIVSPFGVELHVPGDSSQFDMVTHMCQLLNAALSTGIDIGRKMK